MPSLQQKLLLFSDDSPAISVSPASWDFGSTPVGTPVSKVFTIQNTGTAALEITLPITIVGSEASAFTVTAQPGSTSLAPGASTTFTVQADADVVDTFNADISITNNSSENPKLVAIEAEVTIITSGLVAWYDASDASTLWEDSARTVPAADNADVIGAWDDKSGNAYHVTQGTTANKPTLRTNVQNGKNVIRYDGSDDFLANISFSDFSDNYSILIVVKEASGGAGDNTQGIFEVSNGSLNTGFSLHHPNTASLIFRGIDSVGNKTLSGGDYRDEAARIHRLVNSGTQLKWSVNNVALTPVAYTAPNPNTLSRIDIGRVIAAGYFTNGDICELLIYNRTLSGAEETALETQLNAKWGVY